MLSCRQDMILEELRSGPLSSTRLADILMAPTASVRRDIQALRRAGHVIVANGYGKYRLVAA